MPTTLVFLVTLGAIPAQPRRFYAHPAVLDGRGVIAPWYNGQNGQFDWRVRIAAETMKRYPWTDTSRAVAAAPEYVFSGAWNITPDGTITIPPINDWANGDLGQRAAYVLTALVDYYRYTGDAAAIAHITLQADTLLDHGLTPADHPWPGFLISVPTKGKPYGACDPHGFIQLDIVAEVGLALVRASHMTGNTRWLDAAKHWADLLAEKRCREPGVAPWGRYANPDDAPWEDPMTGGIVFLLDFFDALIRAGYTGRDNAIVEAREAGAAYLRDVLLPEWAGPETWGRNYWDWPCPVQVENVTEFAARYVIEHPAEFPDWRCDARNILTLFLNRTCVSPVSNGDVYAGAWAYPESSGCCGRSLWYGPLELGNVYAEYGVLADSAWAREIARRSMILATYDAHETGVVEDNIDGGGVVADAWFKIAHPMALKHVLGVIAWMPEVFGASRENHIVRSSSVVSSVVYGDGAITYTTHDAIAPCEDVLRLAFRPSRVRADGVELTARADGGGVGYRLRALPDGDWIVTIRHDGRTTVSIEGNDPQDEIDDGALTFSGPWETRPCAPAMSGGERVATNAGATMRYEFAGNQVRVMGSVGPDGGLADVKLDGAKQLAGIDAWSPSPRERQVLWYRNGLANGRHTLEITTTGRGNPRSDGSAVWIDGVQVSAATPTPGAPPLGAGEGPTEAQRLLFGYTGRTDYKDSAGNTWRPGTEFVVRAGVTVDSVAASWWTTRRQHDVLGTRDAELYRYGIHGSEFWVPLTVGPGRYHVRVRLCETRRVDADKRAMTIAINGRDVVQDLDVAATALAHARAGAPSATPWDAPTSGFGRAVDLVFSGIEPAAGMIVVHFRGSRGGEAMVQAIEIAPGDGGEGAEPVSLPPAPTTTQSAEKPK